MRKHSRIKSIKHKVSSHLSRPRTTRKHNKTLASHTNRPRKTSGVAWK